MGVSYEDTRNPRGHPSVVALTNLTMIAGNAIALEALVRFRANGIGPEGYSKADDRMRQNASGGER
jgi:hypothetical protein